MTPHELKLAETAHDCWRIMQEHYLLHPDDLPKPSSTADALLPFHLLSQIDRDTAIQGIRHYQATQALAAMIEYPRGPDRPITTDEAKAGIRVSLVDDPASIGTLISHEAGEFDWQTITVQVKWDDGVITTHITEERELRRV